MNCCKKFNRGVANENTTQKKLFLSKTLHILQRHLWNCNLTFYHKVAILVFFFKNPTYLSMYVHFFESLKKKNNRNNYWCIHIFSDVGYWKLNIYSITLYTFYLGMSVASGNFLPSTKTCGHRLSYAVGAPRSDDKGAVFIFFKCKSIQKMRVDQSLRGEKFASR